MVTAELDIAEITFSTKNNWEYSSHAVKWSQKLIQSNNSLREIENYTIATLVQAIKLVILGVCRSLLNSSSFMQIDSRSRLS